MNRNFYYTLFAILMTALMSVSITSCGSEDSASDIDDSQSKFTYTIGTQTYTYSKYMQSSIGSLEDNWVHGNRRIYWEIELCGAVDGGVDWGSALTFEIFTQDVEKGFELTKDNFCVPYMSTVIDFSTPIKFDFQKKSGSAKLTEFGEHSAKIVFKDFVMEADEASFNITVNGTVDLKVD